MKNKFDLSGFVGLGGSIVLSLWLMVLGQGTNLNQQKVEAKEYIKPVVVVSPNSQMTEKQQIMSYIVEIFGDDADDAIKIADCESGLNPNQIGDQHLMSFDEKWQEMKGDSIGIFQIRTGGEDFNRARANGMSTDEFRAKLKDFRYNIDYAKTIYDRAGDWSPWFNCMNKVGL
jgi:hypothetical protein